MSGRAREVDKLRFEGGLVVLSLPFEPSRPVVNSEAALRRNLVRPCDAGPRED